MARPPSSLMYGWPPTDRVFLNSPLSFLKQHLGASGPESADTEALKLEVTELRTKVEQLTEENNELKTKVRV